MITVTCDLCDKKVSSLDDLLTIEVYDGEHPHNSSTMYKKVDVCFKCLKKIQTKTKQLIRINVEYNTLI